jgi:hypothetical protein
MFASIRQPSRWAAASRSLSTIALLCACATSQAHDDAQVVAGNWKLVAAVDGADVVARDEREAQELIGQVMTISADKIAFGKRVCGRSSFETQRVEPRLFVREQFRASAARLHLPNPVTVVQLSCTAVFVKSRDKLLIFWDGWFFDAVRVKP